MSNGWIGVDLDGTLATYVTTQAPHLGLPIKPMVDRVKRWLADGREVRIVTARATHPRFCCDNQKSNIEEWCLEYLGAVLPIQSGKDHEMLELWDDRCVQVETNTGRVIGISRIDHDLLP